MDEYIKDYLLQKLAYEESDFPSAFVLRKHAAAEKILEFAGKPFDEAIKGITDAGFKHLEGGAGAQARGNFLANVEGFLKRSSKAKDVPGAFENIAGNDWHFFKKGNQIHAFYTDKNGILRHISEHEQLKQLGLDKKWQKLLGGTAKKKAAKKVAQAATEAKQSNLSPWLYGGALGGGGMLIGHELGRRRD